MSTKTGTKDNLLVIRDNTSGYNFLLDTGAEVSILPASSHYIKNLQQTHLLSGPDEKSYSRSYVPKANEKFQS